MGAIFADQNTQIKINHLPSTRSISNVDKGIDAFCLKPLNLTELAQTVRLVLDRAG